MEEEAAVGAKGEGGEEEEETFIMTVFLSSFLLVRKHFREIDSCPRTTAAFLRV